eukprot:6045989-Lingulodinium_polyedra.AAC.1
MYERHDWHAQRERHNGQNQDGFVASCSLLTPRCAWLTLQRAPPIVHCSMLVAQWPTRSARCGYAEFWRAAR